MNKLTNLIAAVLATISLNSFATECPPLSGDVVIGKSETSDFATISEAVDALRCGGVSGPVTFKIEAGTYNEKVVISSIPGVSSFNPIKFESVSGSSSDVTISYGKSDATLVVSSPYVSLENISISHKDGTYGNCMRVEGKASNLHFKNAIFDGINNPQHGADNAVVYFTATASKTDIYFEDCEVNYGSIGIWKSGMSVSCPDHKTFVSGTLFFGQTESGLVLTNEDAPVISNNAISTISNEKGFKAILLDNVVNRVIVSRNILNTSSGAMGLVMNNCNAQDNAPGQINSNTVTINGNTDALGICLTGSTANQVLNFNRIKLTVNTAQASAQGYYKNTSYGDNINMMNNIFIDMNTGVYTIIGNSYKDFFNQLPSQSNQTLSASANSFSMEKVASIK